MNTDLRSTVITLFVGASILAACDDATSNGTPPTLTETQLDSAGTPSFDAVEGSDTVPLDSASSDASLPRVDIAPKAEDAGGDPPLVSFMPLSDDGDVVSFVEVERYMGLWYEIATTPSFQQGACSNTKANYTYNATQGWVDVVNMCTIGGVNGTPQELQGRAEVVDQRTQAKLAVTFFGQTAPYWVVALDGTQESAPYQWAVVSVPGNEVMWLLARESSMPPELREEIENHLASRGFPVDTLIDTTHQ